jgi:hypothetical protein
VQDFSSTLLILQESCKEEDYRFGRSLTILASSLWFVSRTPLKQVFTANPKQFKAMTAVLPESGAVPGEQSESHNT